MTAPDRPPAGPSPDGPPPGPRTQVLTGIIVAGYYARNRPDGTPDPMPLPGTPKPSRAWHRLRAVGIGLTSGSVLALAGLAFVATAVAR